MEFEKIKNLIEFFFKNPYIEIHLRDLSRRLKLSPYATKIYVDYLIKNKLILEDKRANLRYLKANMQNILFRKLKLVYSISLISKSGLLDYFYKESQKISSIVLFGSVARAEDDNNSDIDLVIIGAKKDLDLSEYEKKLKKEINLHSFSWGDWHKQYKSNNAFYSDVIIHGISLYGDLPLIS